MLVRDDLPYRQSTLAIVTNDQGKFLVVNKMAYKEGQWAFPGGGVDEGEIPEQALRRELVEELLSDKFEIVKQSSHSYQYEWPDEIIEDVGKNKGTYFRGTQLTQFFVKFVGEENEVKAGDGIREVRWVGRNELKAHLIFPNQWEKAEQVISEFIG